jgi:hypothetical protein
MIVDLVDKLIERAIQLYQHRREVSKATFARNVTPAYEAFEQVHAAYLDSFARYRARLRESPDLLRPASPLLDEIRRENLFTAHTRARVLELAQAGGDDELQHFVRAIHDYLLRARSGQALLTELHPDRPEQRFRNSLIADLEEVIAENWQSCLDPYLSMPPLSPLEIHAQVEAVARQAGIPDDDPQREQKIKGAFAIRALDRIVGEMQEAYAEVTARYQEARVAQGV